MVGADDSADGVRHHEPDPRDDPGQRHARRGHERGDDHEEGPHPARVHPQRARFVVADREHVEAPGGAPEDEHPEDHDRRRDRDIRPGRVVEPTHRPEHDGAQGLIVRQVLHGRQRRLEHRVRHDAGQQQAGDGLAAIVLRHAVGETHGKQTPSKRAHLEAGGESRQQQCQARPRTTRQTRRQE